MTESALVHVIDDDDAARESLAFMLSANQFLVRDYPSAMAFISALPVMEGCIVTDLKMPEISGVDLIRDLKRRRVELPVIVITGQGDVPLAVEAIREGAIDFIEKPFEEEVLLGAVRLAINRDEHWVLEKMRAIQGRLAVLSPRERQIVDGFAAGHSNEAVANDLGVSLRVFEVHRANILTKMQATSLSELVRMVLIANR